MTDQPFVPSIKQQSVAEMAQNDVEETLRRLLGDGNDFHAVLTGATTALAQILATGAGEAAVPRWFEGARKLTEHYGRTH